MSDLKYAGYNSISVAVCRDVIVEYFYDLCS
jgi:hypothetical protein